MKGEQDVIIIGGGHNGLTTAAYLAKAGKRVTVLEARSILGGAAVTEEFVPGYRNSTASYTVSLLNPKVIADLKLSDHELQVIERPVANYYPYPDGTDFLLPYGDDAQLAAVSALSPQDRQAWQRYGRDIDLAASILKDQLTRIPPNPKGGIGDILSMLRLGRRFRALPARDQQMVLDLFTRSADEFLRGYFTSEKLIAALVFDGIIGHYAPPDAPGSAYVLLHHAFGEVNGKPGVWGHAVGGMGAISNAIASAAKAAGAHLRTDTPVERVLIEKGKAIGVITKAGETLRANTIASAVGPKLLVDKLMDPADVPDTFRERMDNWVTASGVFRMNVALSDLPQFKGRDNQESTAYLEAGIVIGPSSAYLRRAYEDARNTGWSKQPFIEMLIPSTIDDSLAPAGHHVCSLFCQYVAPTLPDGRDWDTVKRDVADLMINTVDRYAPGFKGLVVGYDALSPKDLETRFGLMGGDIFHGRLSIDQLFSARPMMGHADYRLPVQGLYLCGSGAHPGGGVTGLPGHNAAQIMLRDLR